MTGPGGATDVNYIGTIEFTSTDPMAALPAAYTFTPADAGTHAFSVTFQSGGTRSITATDTVNSSIMVTATVSVSGSTPATATFLKPDFTTQGTWMGTYGSQGYDVIDGPSSLPSYASITPAGAKLRLGRVDDRPPRPADLRRRAGSRRPGGRRRASASMWT